MALQIESFVQTQELQIPKEKDALNHLTELHLQKIMLLRQWKDALLEEKVCF